MALHETVRVGGANRGETEAEIQDEVGSPSADGQTLYDILANADVDALTTHGDSLANRIDDNLAEDPGETLHAILAGADINDLTTQGDAVVDRLAANLAESPQGTVDALLLGTALSGLTLTSDSALDVLNRIRTNSDLSADFSATATDKNTDTEIRDGVWSDSQKAQAARIDAAVSSRTPAPSDPTTGTLSADGTEQTVFTVNPATAGTAVYYLDLVNMASGDTVVVREKVDVDDDGTFSTFASTTFTDAQTESVVGPSTDFLAHSSAPFRVTVEQTGGTNRDYPFAHGVVR